MTSQQTSIAPWPNFTEEEANAVAKTLLSNKVNYWTGEEVREFEKEFSEFASTNHAIALANGTVALDLALHGLNIGARNGGESTDEVIVTCRSFIASVSCVVNAGAIPVFADIDQHSQNLSPETVGSVITKNTRGIICVHLAGLPCDMDGFKALVEGKNIKLIEDCAQAHGAKYKNKPVGGLGDVAAWSFCQDKIMTTGGEGGMVTCDDTELWKKMWAHKDHGKSYDTVFNTKHEAGFRWLHESFGTNWRMTEIQAVIGRIQLRRMPEWHKVRTDNANNLSAKLRAYFNQRNISLLIPGTNDPESDEPYIDPNVYTHAWYKFYAFVRSDADNASDQRDSIIAELNKDGFHCSQGSCSEIYLEKAFDNTSYRPEQRLPTAKLLGETSIMFMVHPGMDWQQ